MNTKVIETLFSTGLLGTSSEQERQTWVPVLKIEAWGNKPSGGRVVRLGSHRLAVFRQGANWYATDDACPHHRLGLSGGELEDHTVACPGHGWQFSLVTGKVVKGPPGLRVQVYPVRERGGVLEVNLGLGENGAQ